MNYSKLILVGCISAFVAFLTSVLGVAGTIIGSVISSVLYNMLSEALEKPVSEATFSTNFEWEIAYVFPLVVIALIQLLLIFALLAELGVLPYAFVNFYLSIQDIADNNLYKILGLALIVMSVYPLVLKPGNVKKVHGAILAFVGIVFLARGFVDTGHAITRLYNPVFANFDLPIAIVAFILIVVVILRILISANASEEEFKVIKHTSNDKDSGIDNIHKVYPPKQYRKSTQTKSIRVKNNQWTNNSPKREKASEVHFKNRVDNSVKYDGNEKPGINKSSNNIHFESNDLLDDYKK